MYGNWIEAMYSCGVDVWEGKASGAQPNQMNVNQSAKGEENGVKHQEIPGPDDPPEQTQLIISPVESLEIENRKSIQDVPEVGKQRVHFESDHFDETDQLAASDTGNDVSYQFLYRSL